ncbi:unnamed protein product [Candidula unifasciata]|uniref:Kinetochore protein Nuf2 N-terminal domain-containing protein n=1 Tax=Candidula unifasciata TaxID=100452 RepID=A0A8S3Z0H9_9EUPU|nr:unnamed protein product [Candidula unifasciata]
MSFESPVLPIPEILDCLRESDIIISEHDFKDPNARKWHEVYSRIFEIMALRPIEQAIQSLFKLEKTEAEYPELFEEGFAQMAFTICLRTVLGRFGFQGFCIRDVIQPAPKRLQKIVSVFINSARHVEHRRQVAQEIFDRIQTRRNTCEAVFNQNKKLKTYLAGANETRQQREAELHKLQAEFESEQQTCFELNKVQEEERRTIEEYKLRLAEVEAEKENLKQQLATVTHEVEKISGKIVQSPKRFRKDLERHKNKVEELKTELAKKEQSLSENRLLLEQTANKLTIAEKAVKLTKEVASDRDKKSEIIADIQRQAEALHEQKELYNKYCMQEEDVAEKLRVREEQKQKLTSQIDVRDHAIYQQITDHRQHQDKRKQIVQKLETEATQGGLATVACYKELSNLERIVEEKKADHQREIADAVAEALTVMEMVHGQFASLKSTLLEDEDE